MYQDSRPGNSRTRARHSKQSIRVTRNNVEPSLIRIDEARRSAPRRTAPGLISKSTRFNRLPVVLVVAPILPPRLFPLIIYSPVEQLRLPLGNYVRCILPEFGKNRQGSLPTVHLSSRHRRRNFWTGSRNFYTNPRQTDITHWLIEIRRLSSTRFLITESCYEIQSNAKV